MTVDEITALAGRYHDEHQGAHLRRAGLPERLTAADRHRYIADILDHPQAAEALRRMYQEAR